MWLDSQIPWLTRLRLGHYGLVIKDFQAQFDFYIKSFNFMPNNLL